MEAGIVFGPSFETIARKCARPPQMTVECVANEKQTQSQLRRTHHMPPWLRIWIASLRSQ
jgi:cytochrome c551/c552